MVMPIQATLKNVIIGGALLGMAHGMSVEANEDKITKGFYTMDAMGCMLLGECTDGVKQVHTMLDVSTEYDDPERFTGVAHEFNRMVDALKVVGSNVYLADQKYFPIGHRGVYHTVSNNMYLNKAYMHRPSALMSVVRHEGWHAAQDCMAGTIKNNMIAIIHNEEDVPMIWQELAKRTYRDMPHAIPWEKEASWAGKTENMTMKALQSCARGTMWTDYEPTPLTGEWLRENGYIK